MKGTENVVILIWLTSETLLTEPKMNKISWPKSLNIKTVYDNKTKNGFFKIQLIINSEIGFEINFDPHLYFNYLALCHCKFFM